MNQLASFITSNATVKLNFGGLNGENDVDPQSVKLESVFIHEGFSNKSDPNSDSIALIKYTLNLIRTKK